MAVASAAAKHSKNLMNLGLALFRRGFNSSKCKTAAKMAVARMKLLRNKREAAVKQMRRDIALLLQSGQDATARIRVEHVIREQNVMSANEIIELFCELVVSRLSIIAKHRECPADLKEGIASLIFASPRCSEIPELVAIRNIFEKKYGEDFVSAAMDLRPNSGVNRMLIDKLSVRTPTGEVKLKVMKEIAKEHQIEWDTTESEMELLKPPEEHIEGPRTFVSAASLPIKPSPIHYVEPNKQTTSGGERGTMQFEDATSAAEAAAESAKEAIAAAQAAAYLANKDPNGFTHASGFDNCVKTSSSEFFKPNDPPFTTQNTDRQTKLPGRIYESQSFGRSHYLSNEDRKPVHPDGGEVHYRRNSYNAPSAESDIKFDESDCEEEIELGQPPAGVYLPPNRLPPPVPPVHHKLPDYDPLAARFDSLKYHK